MKNIIFLLSLTLSTSVFACPDLSGTYYDDKKEIQQISMSKEDGVTVLNDKITSPDGKVFKYKYILDGKVHQRLETEGSGLVDTHYAARCVRVEGTPLIEITYIWSSDLTGVSTYKVLLTKTPKGISAQMKVDDQVDVIVEYGNTPPAQTN